MTGPLALVGGAEWTDGCVFDHRLLELSGGSVVTVVPAAAAFENPQKSIDRAAAWFAGFGATIDVVPVYKRADALDAAQAAPLVAARFVYLADGSAAHLRSVLKDTPLLDAIVAAWQAGAVLAASGHAATALCDAMVDQRGGAFTVGLGVLTSLTVIPRFGGWSRDKTHRTVQMAPAELVVAGIDDRTALLNISDEWSVAGAGNVTFFRNHQLADLSALSD